jgi:drug/metabolite transporter (DMT)-like permease
MARFQLNLKRENIKWYLLAGGCLFSASALQQAGMMTTTAGNAGFITGIYVILIPVLLAMFWKQRQSLLTWAAVLLIVPGMYLLSGTGVIRFVIGDWLELAGALFWALHVIVVGRAMKHVDVLQFSIGQFFTTSILSFSAGFLFETSTLAGYIQAWISILYVAIFSTAIGYTLQAYGQRFAPATDAAIILSLETVFAALFGFLVLGENLTPSQIMGCVIILAAIVIAQLAGMRTQSVPSPVSEG